MEKFEALQKGISALRGNIEQLEQFSRELDDLIGKCISYLSDYRSWWQQRLQADHAELSARVKAAVQEATNCLDQETEPVSGLAKALGNWRLERLQLVSYSVKSPDLPSICETWISYQNNLQSLCEHFDKKPLLPCVLLNHLFLYDTESQEVTHHKLSPDPEVALSFLQIDAATLLCWGGRIDYFTSTIYELDHSYLCLLFAYTGVAKIGRFIYFFGGTTNNNVKDDSNLLNSCEKYEQDKQFFSLPDMQEARCSFFPCTFHTLIYLLDPRNSLAIETFCSATETFSVLPVSLPSEFQCNSVSFVYNDEIFILTERKQMGRWRIGSASEFRIYITNMEICSLLSPIITDSHAFILSPSMDSFGVVKFNLETCSSTLTPFS